MRTCFQKWMDLSELYYSWQAGRLHPRLCNKHKRQHATRGRTVWRPVKGNKNASSEAGRAREQSESGLRLLAPRCPETQTSRELAPRTPLSGVPIGLERTSRLAAAVIVYLRTLFVIPWIRELGLPFKLGRPQTPCADAPENQAHTVAMHTSTVWMACCGSRDSQRRTVSCASLIPPIAAEGRLSRDNKDSDRRCCRCRSTSLLL